VQYGPSATIRPIEPPSRRLAVAVLLALAGSGCGQEDTTGVQSPPLAEPAAQPAELPPGRGHLLARVRGNVLVHDRPEGRPIARLRPRTPFGGPRTLGVVEIRDEGRWLGVHSPVLGNERIGWIQNDAAALALARTRISLHVALSRTEIAVKRGRRTIRSIPIAIGAAGTSTPPGRFQVTDKLPASRFPAGPYGCCILALSARQPNLPESWAGGDRIAIHGTARPETIGRAASNGCLRASDPDLRALMRDVPIGAPVFIRP
jgi:lipoprotein-anchoring transpeptidase ErfK/SrfK